MHASQGLIARLRLIAGPVLLALFLVAAQLGPLAHLGTHRNDHTHGPAPDAHADDHDDDHGHDDTPDHDHDAGGDHDHSPAPVHPHDDHVGTPDADHVGDHDRAEADHHHDASPGGNGDPVEQHGEASAAHFGLALIGAPPAPLLAPPSSIDARPADVPLRGHTSAPLAQPPARGPPRLR